VHDADFRASERDWHSFVEKLTEKLIEIDDTVPELPVKDIVSIDRAFGERTSPDQLIIFRFSASTGMCGLVPIQLRKRIHARLSETCADPYALYF